MNFHRYKGHEDTDRKGYTRTEVSYIYITDSFLGKNKFTYGVLKKYKSLS